MLSLTSNSQALLLDTPNVAGSPELFDTANMADAADLNGENEVYAALMRVKPPGLAPTRWATDAGFARNLFTNIRQHGKPKLETIRQLLDTIGVSEAEYEAARHPERPTVLSEVRRADLGDVGLPFRPRPGVNVLGSAMGHDYADLDADIELTELYLDEVLGQVDPGPAAQDGHAYALHVVGDSMAPLFASGATVVVSPRQPPAFGDSVIVQLRGPPDDEDDRVKMVLIKRLVRRTRAGIDLEQLNPHKTFSVPAERIVLDGRGRPAIHKVVAVYL
jgi:phage repressor protein C with HTH and peptisase S24 domain